MIKDILENLSLFLIKINNMKNNNNIIPMVTYSASRDKSIIYTENKKNLVFTVEII